MENKWFFKYHAGLFGTVFSVEECEQQEKDTNFYHDSE